MIRIMKKSRRPISQNLMHSPPETKKQPAVASKLSQLLNGLDYRNNPILTVVPQLSKERQQAS